jgi:hypothetical protein
MLATMTESNKTKSRRVFPLFQDGCQFSSKTKEKDGKRLNLDPFPFAPFAFVFL